MNVEGTALRLITSKPRLTRMQCDLSLHRLSDDHGLRVQSQCTGTAAKFLLRSGTPKIISKSRQRQQARARFCANWHTNLRERSV